MNKSQIKTQSKEKRIKNFDEVIIGLSKNVVLDEARRFPQLNDASLYPQSPLGVDIPGFIRILREGNAKGALEKIKERNNLPGVCSRVCPGFDDQNSILSEGALSFDIRALERFAADHGRPPNLLMRKPAKRTGKKIAIIGSGPSGLAAAAHLSKNRFQVTVFEAAPEPGGTLRYGIPGFRLPKNVLDQDINDIKMLGAEIVTSCFIGQTLTVDDLFSQGFSAVLVAVGLGGPRFLPMEGADYGGVYYAEELLTQVSSVKPKDFRKKSYIRIGKKTAVMGTTDKALDCARICTRLGSETSLVFENTEEDLEVDKKELNFAKEEQIKLMGLTKVEEILSNKDNFVSGLKCINLDFADPNSDGKWQLIAVPDSEFVLNVDSLIIATDGAADRNIQHIVPDLKMNEDGTIWMDEEKGMTSVENVFASGDIASRGGYVEEAMSSGIKAADYILRCLL